MSHTLRRLSHSSSAERCLTSPASRRAVLLCVAGVGDAEADREDALHVRRAQVEVQREGTGAREGGSLKKHGERVSVPEDP